MIDRIIFINVLSESHFLNSYLLLTLAFTLTLSRGHKIRNNQEHSVTELLPTWPFLRLLGIYLLCGQAHTTHAHTHNTHTRKHKVKNNQEHPVTEL